MALHRAKKYNQSITNLNQMIDDEQTAQLHQACQQKTIDDTPIDGPPMAGYAHGRHIANRLWYGFPQLLGQTTPR